MAQRQAIWNELLKRFNGQKGRDRPDRRARASARAASAGGARGKRASGRYPAWRADHLCHANRAARGRMALGATCRWECSRCLPATPSWARAWWCWRWPRRCRGGLPESDVPSRPASTIVMSGEDDPVRRDRPAAGGGLAADLNKIHIIDSVILASRPPRLFRACGLTSTRSAPPRTGWAIAG